MNDRPPRVPRNAFFNPEHPGLTAQECRALASHHRIVVTTLRKEAQPNQDAIIWREHLATQFTERAERLEKGAT